MAVELGGSLADRLRLNTAGRDVQVVTGDVDSWPLPAEPFDVVAAFTAWHWCTPGVREDRVRAALRPGGVLATVTTTHVAGGTEAFFAEVQECYERWDPATRPGLRAVRSDDVAADTDEIDASDGFTRAVRRRYEQDLRYSTAEYLDVLRTYSGHRALSAGRREGLLGCIGRLIEGSYGGSVTKRYLYELRVARRR